MDLKKALREERITTRKLTVALDTTRTERNMLHKNYTEALDEIQDLKQKLKVFEPLYIYQSVVDVWHVSYIRLFLMKLKLHSSSFKFGADFSKS